jgi:PilZ domain
MGARTLLDLPPPLLCLGWAVKNRRSLTPLPAGPDSTGLHATRRGEARHELSARVVLTARGESNEPPRILEGWALNVSRGGVRVILEEKVELAAEFDVTIDEPSQGRGPVQTGRIVWVQEEPDGVVAGIAFREPDGA